MRHLVTVRPLMTYRRPGSPHVDPRPGSALPSRGRLSSRRRLTSTAQFVSERLPAGGWGGDLDRVAHAKKQIYPASQCSGPHFRNPMRRVNRHIASPAKTCHAVYIDGKAKRKRIGTETEKVIVSANALGGVSLKDRLLALNGCGS